MSDAFALAATAIAADPNLGVEATFTPATGGAPQTIRVVPTRPEDSFGAVDGPRMIAPSVSVMIPAAALTARPAKGDHVAWGGLVFVIMEVAQDTRAASWTCALRRA